MLYLPDKTSFRFRSPQSLWIFGITFFVVGGLLVWGWLRPHHTLLLYWLTDVNNDLYYVQQQRSFSSLTLEDAIAQAIKNLIQGNRDSRLVSALPSETEILNVRVEGDDIFLNFSRDLTQGGGSTSILGRVTQILYTATSHNPNARVWISVEGEALSTLGGEGLLLEQPLSRASFQGTVQAPFVFKSLSELDAFNQHLTKTQSK
jgi:spore germination protein GerM